MQGCRRLVDMGRRQFLRGGALAAAGAAANTVMPAKAHAKPPPARVDYPSSKIGTVAQLTT
jgi:arsenite oxidase small subunit